jgi:hypothetical protein
VVDERSLQRVPDTVREVARSVAGRAVRFPPDGSDRAARSDGEGVFELALEEQPFPGLDLSFRDRGNEQLIYTVAQYPGVVVKVHWYDTKLAIDSLGVESRAHWLDGTIGDTVKNVMHAQAERTSRRLAALRSSFGDGHSVPTPCGTVNFPGRVFRELGFRGAIGGEIRSVIPAPVAVQQRHDFRSGFDLRSGLAGPDGVSATDVVRAGRKWVERSSPMGFEPDLLNRLSPDNSAVDFVDAIEGRPELARSAREFLNGARHFTRTTRELLAVRG